MILHAAAAGPPPIALLPGFAVRRAASITHGSAAALPAGRWRRSMRTGSPPFCSIRRTVALGALFRQRMRSRLAQLAVPGIAGDRRSGARALPFGSVAAAAVRKRPPCSICLPDARGAGDRVRAVTDEPPNGGATPTRSGGAARCPRRTGRRPGSARRRPDGEGRRSDWLGVGASWVAAAFLGGAAALFPARPHRHSGQRADDARERIGALEDRASDGWRRAVRTGRPPIPTATSPRSRLDWTCASGAFRSDRRSRWNCPPRCRPKAPKPGHRIAALDSALADFGTSSGAVGLASRGLPPAPPAPAVPAPAAPAPRRRRARRSVVAEVQTLSSQLGDLATRLGAVETALRARSRRGARPPPVGSGKRRSWPRRLQRRRWRWQFLADAVASGRPSPPSWRRFAAARPSISRRSSLMPALACRRCAASPNSLGARPGDPGGGRRKDRGSDWLDRLWRGLPGPPRWVGRNRWAVKPEDRSNGRSCARGRRSASPRRARSNGCGPGARRR